MTRLKRTAQHILSWNNIDGRTLEEVLRSRKMPMGVDETLNIITPILETLSKVHRVGIIHRDIAPDNIWVMDNGKIKLLDFGAARYALGEKSQSLSVILKHGYAPPEQYATRGKQVCVDGHLCHLRDDVCHADKEYIAVIHGYHDG